MSTLSRGVSFSSRLRASFRLGTAVAMVAGGILAAAPGCSGATDEYRCDDTGCFQCDGFGCRAIPAPTPPSCGFAGDPACTDGEVCTDYGCLAPCTTDASCAKGLVCKKGLCTPPTFAPISIKECGSSTDCTKLGDGATCVDGKCVAGPACSGTDCTCKYSSDCGTGRICVDGKCDLSCSDASPCPSGFTCDAKGYCVEGAPNCGPAGAGATCKSTEKCVDGHCAPTCTKDGDCGTGFACVSGACAVDTNTHPTCKGDTECSSTQKCVGGFCKYTCGADTDCLKIDARIGSCSPTEKICRAPSEVSAKCTTKADCSATQDCVDGSCK